MKTICNLLYRKKTRDKKEPKFRIKFLDSYNFQSASLDVLAESLKAGGHILERLKQGLENLGYTDSELIKLLSQKGFFPYEYITDFKLLEEKSLPPINAFKSSLTGETISSEDYDHCLRIFELGKCRNLKDYMEIYLLVDVLLLSEIMIKFRHVCIEKFQLDPVAHCSTPAIAEQSALLTKDGDHTIELLCDAEPVNDIKSNLRGGYCGVTIGHALLNDSCTSEFNDKMDEKTAILADVNSLYPTIMSQKLPIGKYKKLEGNLLADFASNWSSLPTNGDYAYLVWFRFRMTDDVKRKLDDFPLIFTNRKVTRNDVSQYTNDLISECRYNLGASKTLIASHEGDQYFSTLGYMQLLQSLGVQIIEVEKVYRFRQEEVFKKYIERNIELRNQATTPFERNLFKLFSNALFGKMLYNPEKNQIRTHIVTDPRDFRRKINNLLLTDAYPIDEHKVIMKIRDGKIDLKHPQYIGFFILEEAKRYMGNLFHNIIKQYYPKTRCAYTDTDSMLLIFEGINIIESLKDTPLFDYFDTSNFDQSHACYDNSRRNKIGLLKSETGSCHISEVVCLQPKCYAIRLADGTLKTACKGVHKKMKDQIPFQTYLDIHNSLKKEHITRNGNIVSRRNELITMVNTKRAFCKVDRKRFYLDSVNSYAYGHPDIPRKAVKRKSEPPVNITFSLDESYDSDANLLSIPTNFTGHISKKCKNVFN